MSEAIVTLHSVDRRISVVPDCVESPSFRHLRDSVLRRFSAPDFPAPMRGPRTTVPYQQLKNTCPVIAGLYESDILREVVSQIAGISLRPTQASDSNSCALLMYRRPGDRLDWHYDKNFYRGRHFTGLLSLVNERIGEPRLSSANLVVKRDVFNVQIPMPPNTLVLLEGTHVRHRVTPLGHNERRMVLSMSFCSDPTTTALKGLQRRFNEVALAGLRALWV